jgi:hypothetical protein
MEPAGYSNQSFPAALHMTSLIASASFVVGWLALNNFASHLFPCFNVACAPFYNSLAVVFEGHKIAFLYSS